MAGSPSSAVRRSLPRPLQAELGVSGHPARLAKDEVKHHTLARALEETLGGVIDDCRKDVRADGDGERQDGIDDDLRLRH
jgi:hypothetical protein